MVAVVYLVGLFAGMLRKHGWLVVPLAALGPAVLAAVEGVELVFNEIMFDAMLWAGAGAAGCFMSLIVQTYVIDSWMRDNSNRPQ